jgi:hypothetical protein
VVTSLTSAATLLIRFARKPGPIADADGNVLGLTHWNNEVLGSEAWNDEPAFTEVLMVETVNGEPVFAVTRNRPAWDPECCYRILSADESELGFIALPKIRDAVKPMAELIPRGRRHMIIGFTDYDLIGRDTHEVLAEILGGGAKDPTINFADSTSRVLRLLTIAAAFPLWRELQERKPTDT